MPGYKNQSNVPWSYVPGFGGGGGPMFGGQNMQGTGFFNWPKPPGYNFWNPQATQTQNQAFNIPDYQKNKALLFKKYNQYENMGLNELLETRPEQLEFLNTLKLNAAGQGPSVAQNLLRQGTDRNVLQNLALQASARGDQNSGLTQYLLSQQSAGANQQAAQQAAILRSQEMAQAQGQYGAGLSDFAQQDLQAKDFLAKMSTYYLSQGLNLNQAQAQANQALESLLAGQYQAAQALAAQQSMADQYRKQMQTNAWIGAGATVVGAIAGAFAGKGAGSGGSAPITGGGGGYPTTADIPVYYPE